MTVFPIGHIDQSHYHLTKTHERAIDAAGLLKEKQLRQYPSATKTLSMRLDPWVELHLESGAFCMCVFLPFRTCQIDQVQLRHPDVYHFVDRLLRL